MRKKPLLVIFLLLIFSVCANAVSLEKRHQLCLKVGIWHIVDRTPAEIPLGRGEISIGNSGLVGGLSYGHWLLENLAITFSANGIKFDITASTNTSDNLSETAAVTSLLIGVKHYYLKSSLVSPLRPYYKVGIGPYFGSQSTSNSANADIITSRTELAIGGQMGVGLDVVAGRNFMLGIVIGYNLISDFNEPIGDSYNFSGPEFVFELSWLLGKGI
ncbi:MAG: hypothetical protein ABIJ12_08255 [bacterium]